MITTDNHVGYNEADPIRGSDAAKTFHEIMMIAKEQEVDMVLQAGDLFHINRPSRESMYQVIKTLRMCCLGDKPCEFEVLNHGQLGVDEAFDYVNYEDPNINVAIPVFGISGNHDDSGGASMLSPMDVLSATGLLNHFGRVTENDQITVSPILLRKGTSKLALYGMASVRDERLHRTFKSHNVKFLRPSESSDEWFNMIAVHQNHAAHNATNHLPESFLPDFMDTVIWGHEHECLIDPVKNPDQGFSVIQPGSSVATSLCEGEAVPKYVCIMSITGKEFSVEKFPLKTVRPFKMETVVLSADSFIEPGPDTKIEVTKWMIRKVEKLIDQAKAEWNENHLDDETDESPPLPLIRLRVEYSGGYEVENPTRFSNRFVGRVANVNDVVQYFRKKTPAGKKVTGKSSLAGEAEKPKELALDNVRVRALVEEYLRQQKLAMLQENGLGDAISEFVDKEDKGAVKSFVDDSLATQMKNLLHLGDVDEGTLMEAINKIKNMPIEKDSGKKKDKGKEKEKKDGDSDFEMEEAPSTNNKPKSTRGSGRGGRGGKKAATTTTTRKKKAPPRSAEVIIDSEDEAIASDDPPVPDSVEVQEIEDSDFEEPAPAPRRQTKSRTTNKATTSTTKKAPQKRAAKTKEPEKRATPPPPPFVSFLTPVVFFN